MPSWGRHGWARKNEEMRLYKERDGSYLMLFVDNRNSVFYDGIANNYPGSEPSLSHANIDSEYTTKKGCTRVQWSELPMKWKKAFRYYLTKKPVEIRGFWLVKNMPKMKKVI